VVPTGPQLDGRIDVGVWEEHRMASEVRDVRKLQLTLSGNFERCERNNNLMLGSAVNLLYSHAARYSLTPMSSALATLQGGLFGFV
jgi:hypothetical protein